MPVTAFSAKTTNTQTSAVPVTKGNFYAFDLSGTFDSGSITLQQTIDETNYRNDVDFAAMTAAGIQVFQATGSSVKFTAASGGASMSLTGKLENLGGSLKGVDFSDNAITATES